MLNKRLRKVFVSVKGIYYQVPARRPLIRGAAVAFECAMLIGICRLFRSTFRTRR